MPTSAAWTTQVYRMKPERLPAPSTARTSKLCVPTAIVKASGLEQFANDAASLWSRRHWNETPDSLSVNLKVTGPGAPGLGGSGATNEGVGGGKVSMTQVYEAGPEV